MYGNELATKAAESCRVVGELDRNPTVGENIDFRIAALEKEIERLKASKLTLTPLLDMRIRDIRDAMNY